MAIIGVRQLKSRASLILRSLQEGKVQGYIVTSRGRPVARITPIDEDELEDVLLSMDNPKFRKFIEERRSEPSLSWEDVLGGAKRAKVSRRGKKAS